jgi:hypothetical protein
MPEMTLDDARHVLATLGTKDKLDELHAHACGAGNASVLLVEALRVALADVDRLFSVWSDLGALSSKHLTAKQEVARLRAALLTLSIDIDGLKTVHLGRAYARMGELALRAERAARDPDASPEGA